MKKSKLFLALGALVLTTASILAVKANKKFAAYSGNIFTAAGGNVVNTSNIAVSFFTVTGGGAGHPADINGVLLYTSNNMLTRKQLYY